MGLLVAQGGLVAGGEVTAGVEVEEMIAEETAALAVGEDAEIAPGVVYQVVLADTESGSGGGDFGAELRGGLGADLDEPAGVALSVVSGASCGVNK